MKEKRELNLVIPMAGLGRRFQDAGYKDPKPFIKVFGEPMIQKVVKNLSSDELDINYILILRKDEENEKKVRDIFSDLIKKDRMHFITLDKLTEGAACTILHARKFINNEKPLLLANSDQYIDFNLGDFVKDAYFRELNGSIVVFKDKDPKWSFVKVKDSYVTEVKEKSPISDLATAGIYYFQTGALFVDSALDMIVNNDRVNNEFYTCPVFNYLINNEYDKVGVFEIEASKMHGLGTPEDLEKYIKLEIEKGII